MDSEVLFVSYSLVTKRVSREVPLPSVQPLARPLGTGASTEAAAGADALDGSTIQQNESIEVPAVHPSTHIVGG